MNELLPAVAYTVVFLGFVIAFVAWDHARQQRHNKKDSDTP